MRSWLEKEGNKEGAESNQKAFYVYVKLSNNKTF